MNTSIDRLEDAGDGRRTKRVVTISLMLFLATLVGYIARANVSVALPFVAEEYHWDSEKLGELGGVLLGIFLVGYGISNILMSPLIDHIGPKKSLALAVFSWSILTFATGLFGAVVGAFILARFLLGLSQGPLFPSASKIVSTWFPSSGRARINALYLSTGFLSNLLVPIIFIPLIIVTSWQFMFYFVAIVGFILLIPLWLFIPDISDKRCFRDGQKTSPGGLLAVIKENVASALRIRGLFVITIAFLAINMAWWGLSLWLPTYLIVAKGLAIEELIWAASLPYLGGIFGMYVGSWISDHTGKRVEIAFAFAVCDAILLVIMIFTFSENLIILVAAGVFFFLGVMAPTSFTLLQSVAPTCLVGSATGIMNGIANGAAVLGPIILGFAVAITSSYDIGLVLLAAFQITGALLLLAFPRALLEKENHSK